MKNTLKLQKIEFKLGEEIVISAGPIEITFECGPQEFMEMTKFVMENIQSSIQEIERMTQSFGFNFGR